jgi:hypothetical protein
VTALTHADPALWYTLAAIIAAAVLGLAAERVVRAWDHARAVVDAAPYRAVEHERQLRRADLARARTVASEARMRGESA